MSNLLTIESSIWRAERVCSDVIGFFLPPLVGLIEGSICAASAIRVHHFQMKLMQNINETHRNIILLKKFHVLVEHLKDKCTKEKIAIDTEDLKNLKLVLEKMHNVNFKDVENLKEEIKNFFSSNAFGNYNLLGDLFSEKFFSEEYEDLPVSTDSIDDLFETFQSLEKELHKKQELSNKNINPKQRFDEKSTTYYKKSINLENQIRAFIEKRKEPDILITEEKKTKKKEPETGFTQIQNELESIESHFNASKSEIEHEMQKQFRKIFDEKETVFNKIMDQIQSLNNFYLRQKNQNDLDESSFIIDTLKEKIDLQVLALEASKVYLFIKLKWEKLKLKKRGYHALSCLSFFGAYVYGPYQLTHFKEKKALCCPAVPNLF